MSTGLSASRESATLDLERAIKSDAVQRALPDLVGLNQDLDYELMLANPPASISAVPLDVRRVIKEYATRLDRHERLSPMWEQQQIQYKNQLFSLGSFIIEYDTKCGQINKAAVTQELNAPLFSKETEASRYARGNELLGCSEFEDIYYLLACKTRSLYQDLQIRFASGFITLETVLHDRGADTFAKETVLVPCTVRDLRNFFRAVWFHLLHPKIIHTIETAINARKYEQLKANPLLPTFYDKNQERDYIERFSNGFNLDGSPACHMFDHLEDVSKMPIPAILDKVYRRRMGITPAHPVKETRLHAELKGLGLMWVDLQEDEEDYIQSEIDRTEANCQNSKVFHDEEDDYMQFHEEIKRADDEFHLSRLNESAYEMVQIRDVPRFYDAHQCVDEKCHGGEVKSKRAKVDCTRSSQHPNATHKSHGSPGSKRRRPHSTPSPSKPTTASIPGVAPAPPPHHVLLPSVYIPKSAPARAPLPASQPLSPSLPPPRSSPTSEYNGMASPRPGDMGTGLEEIVSTRPPTEFTSGSYTSSLGPVASAAMAQMLPPRVSSRQTMLYKGVQKSPVTAVKVRSWLDSGTQTSPPSTPSLQRFPTHPHAIHGTPATAIKRTAIPSDQTLSKQMPPGTILKHGSPVTGGKSFQNSPSSRRIPFHGASKFGSPVLTQTSPHGTPPLDAMSPSKEAFQELKYGSASPTKTSSHDNSRLNSMSPSKEVLCGVLKYGTASPTKSLSYSNSQFTSMSPSKVAFHDKVQFEVPDPPPPPKTPPKSELQLKQAQAAREYTLKLQMENEQRKRNEERLQRNEEFLRRENSQLQAIIQKQNRDLARENSRLQEKLAMSQNQASAVASPTKSPPLSPIRSPAKTPGTPSSGGGILRRLSNLGSKSGRASPKKAFRKSDRFWLEKERT